jgi:hypothetical protein
MVNYAGIYIGRRVENQLVMYLQHQMHIAFAPLQVSATFQHCPFHDFPF